MISAFSFGRSATPARIIHTTVDIGAGAMANIFVYLPKGLLTQPPKNGWPVLIGYLGDGADNNATTTVTGAAMSSGDTFTWTLTGANSGSNRILSTSVVIKDDGVEIARGLIGGQIRGNNVSVGSVSLTGSSSAFTFTSSVALSGSITADYIYSTALLEGLPMVQNQGDSLDNRGIVVTVQSRGNDIDLSIGYFDEIIKYLWLNYNINRNRINVTGLSRGARQIIRAALAFAITARYQFWINESTGAVSATDLGAGYVASGLASITCATSDIGGSYTYANYKGVAASNLNGIGVAIVHGTADATLTNNTPTIASGWGAETDALEYPYILDLWNIGHSSTVWHTNFYYRKYGNVGGATALWDYADFAWKYSKDLEESCTLFVEQAENRRTGGELDIIDYREALRKVNSLSAGAVKTALLARLATLKTELDSEIVWRTIINHTNGSISATGNINNQTTHVDNARVDNLIDDNGNTLTGVDWFIGNNPLASAYESEIGSNRGRCNVGGFQQEVNRVGMRISSTVCPVGFDGLPAGTYTLRIYHNEGSGGFTQKELTATIGGVSKTSFSQINTLIGYTEWTGLDETDLANFNIGRNTADIYVTAVELIRTA